MKIDLPENTERARHKVPKLKLIDKIHRAAVLTCIGIGGVAALLCGIIGLNYYINVKPEIRRETLKKQRELLQEGSAFDDEHISKVS